MFIYSAVQCSVICRVCQYSWYCFIVMAMSANKSIKNIKANAVSVNKLANKHHFAMLNIQNV